MARRSMDKEEITAMYNEQKEIYLKETDFIEDHVNFDKKRFFKDARKIGWDIEIDKYATVKKLDINHGIINQSQLGLLYCYGVKQGLIDETDETYLKLMLKNAKEKAKLHETEYFQEFDKDELIPILRNIGINTFDLDLVEDYLQAMDELISVKEGK